MGSSPKNYTSFALIVSVAVLSVVAVFSTFSSPASSQFLLNSNNDATNLSQIINVRFGEHFDKTRMVIDLKHPTKLSYNISRDGKTINLELPNATWDTSKILPRQNITDQIIDFNHTALLKGSKLTLISKIPVSIKPPFSLLPREKNGHRIVIDFVPRTTPIIKNPTLSLVASLDNTGALPRQMTEVAQLSRTQNPYIQRAFPQNNLQRQKPKPAQSTLKKRPSPPSPNRTRQNPRTQPAYQPPYQTEGLQQKVLAFGLNNTYIRGSVGMQLADESSNDGNGVYDQEWDPGFILSGVIGTKLEDGFRAEGEFFYASASLKQVSGSWNGSVYNTERVQGDISSTAIMGNIVYDFQSNSRLTPYGMAGIGMSLLSLNDLNASNIAMANDMDLVAALQVGAGFSLDLDKKTKIDIGYRYFETQNPEFSDSTGTPYESVFASHNFLLGARVELN
jgi:opacity protein-like surface antigen